jgi:geranylgeranyl diphosphate synthase type I
LREFLDNRVALLLDVSPALQQLQQVLRDFLLDGGKCLRPTFCYTGWQGAGGDPLSAGILNAAASLELLHACALIHDDIMDASDIRRGKPSVHRRLANMHSNARLRGLPDSFGTAVAILLGDLCLTWCHHMLDECGLPADAVRNAKSLSHLMITEVIAGQCLDVIEQARGFSSVERARTVIHYKTAKYTIERPLQIGAVLAGADADLLAMYSSFALPLGEAFQLRDDVLGVFGDPAETGKPVGDDLRGGKPNVLLTLAREAATTAQCAEIDTLLGDAQLGIKALDSLRETIVSTGALATVEGMITQLTNTALAVLDNARLHGDTDRLLAELAVSATSRVR